MKSGNETQKMWFLIHFHISNIMVVYVYKRNIILKLKYIKNINI